MFSPCTHSQRRRGHKKCRPLRIFDHDDERSWFTFADAVGVVETRMRAGRYDFRKARGMCRSCPRLSTSRAFRPHLMLCFRTLHTTPITPILRSLPWPPIPDDHSLTSGLFTLVMATNYVRVCFDVHCDLFHADSLLIAGRPIQVRQRSEQLLSPCSFVELGRRLANRARYLSRAHPTSIEGRVSQTSKSFRTRKTTSGEGSPRRNPNGEASGGLGA